MGQHIVRRNERRAPSQQLDFRISLVSKHRDSAASYDGLTGRRGAADPDLQAVPRLTHALSSRRSERRSPGKAKGFGHVTKCTQALRLRSIGIPARGLAQ